MITLQRINSNLSLSAPRAVVVSGIEYIRVIRRLNNDICVSQRNSKTGKIMEKHFDSMEDAETEYNAN